VDDGTGYRKADQLENVREQDHKKIDYLISKVLSGGGKYLKYFIRLFQSGRILLT